MSSKKVRALPHQTEGVKFLRDRDAAALFDEQGLGKSKQLIDAVDKEVAAGSIRGAVIVCPNGLKSNWAQEIETHSGARYAVFGSGKKARRDGFRSLAATFYIINYEAIAAELPSLRALLRFKRMALVLDESHRIKSPEARVTRAVQQIQKEAARRYIMTGTPVANKPEDLWSQLFFLDDGKTFGGSYAEFRSRYCTAKGGYTRLDELKSQLAEVSLRREKEGTIRLPSKTLTRASVELAPAQRRLYDELREELAVWVQSLSGEEVLAEAENILARMVRLAQIASNPSLLDARYREVPTKLRALDELLPRYLKSPERKVIVWTSFVGNIPVMLGRYARYKPVAIHGAMDGRARDRSVKAFRKDPSVRLLVANPAAAREGLTLTECNVAIYIDRTFNLVDFLQSQDRIHRISQTRDCEIVLLIAKGTVDEFIDFSLAQKHRVARYAQGDSLKISDDDLALKKPDVLRALLGSTKRNKRGAK